MTVMLHFKSCKMHQIEVLRECYSSSIYCIFFVELFINLFIFCLCPTKISYPNVLKHFYFFQTATKHLEKNLEDSPVYFRGDRFLQRYLVKTHPFASGSEQHPFGYTAAPQPQNSVTVACAPEVTPGGVFGIGAHRNWQPRCNLWVSMQTFHIR